MVIIVLVMIIMAKTNKYPTKPSKVGPFVSNCTIIFVINEKWGWKMLSTLCSAVRAKEEMYMYIHMNIRRGREYVPIGESLIG